MARKKIPSSINENKATKDDGQSSGNCVADPAGNPLQVQSGKGLQEPSGNPQQKNYPAKNVGRSVAMNGNDSLEQELASQLVKITPSTKKRASSTFTDGKQELAKVVPKDACPPANKRARSTKSGDIDKVNPKCAIHVSKKKGPSTRRQTKEDRNNDNRRLQQGEPAVVLPEMSERRQRSVTTMTSNAVHGSKPVATTSIHESSPITHSVVKTSIPKSSPIPRSVEMTSIPQNSSIPRSVAMTLIHERSPMSHSVATTSIHGRSPMSHSVATTSIHERSPMPHSVAMTSIHERSPIPHSGATTSTHESPPIPHTFATTSIHDSSPIPHPVAMTSIHENSPMPHTFATTSFHDSSPIPHSVAMTSIPQSSPITHSVTMTSIHDSSPMAHSGATTSNQLLQQDTVSSTSLVGASSRQRTTATYATSQHDVGGLRTKYISMIPTSQFWPVSTRDTHESCIICMESYETGDVLKTLDCQHQFHADCLDEWLEIRKLCPVCRLIVTARL